MPVQSAPRKPRLHSSRKSHLGPPTPIYSPLDKGQGVLKVLHPPVVHAVVDGQVSSSTYTWDAGCPNKPSERPRSRRVESDLSPDQGGSEHESFVRTPLIRTNTVESLPPPIPSPPWSRNHHWQKTVIVDDSTPTTSDLDKRPCRYNSSTPSKGDKWHTRPFFKRQGTNEYSDQDSEHEGYSSGLKNARADAIALAQFRQIVESRRAAESNSSSDTDESYEPYSRVSTPEGYPEALRNRYRSKRPRSKSWDRSQLPCAKKQRLWVPTIVVTRPSDSDIEMPDDEQSVHTDIRPSSASSCSFADNDSKMDCSLSSTAGSSSRQISDHMALSPPPTDRPHSEPEAMNSSRRLHCPVPGCTASYHSLWAYDRHRAKHKMSLPSPILAMNCSKCGPAPKRFDSSESHMKEGERLIWCCFGCQLHFSHVWKKEIHYDRMHRGKALEPSMCRECGAKPTDSVESLQKISSQMDRNTPPIPSICNAEHIGTKVSETAVPQPMLFKNPENSRPRLSTPSRRRIASNPPLAASAGISPAPPKPPIIVPTVIAPHNPEDKGMEMSRNSIQTPCPPSALQTPQAFSFEFIQVQPMDMQNHKAKFKNTILTKDGKRQTYAV